MEAFLGKDNKSEIYAYIIYPSKSESKFDPRLDKQ
jgi:hypothetical protein